MDATIGEFFDLAHFWRNTRKRNLNSRKSLNLVVESIYEVFNI